MLIKVVWIGKTRNSWIRALAEDYFDRLRHFTNCEIVEMRDPPRRRSLGRSARAEAEGDEISKRVARSERWVSLDEKGKELSSVEFARWLASEENRGTREVAFVVGGPEGLSAAVLERSHLRLSLGRMTWTHEMCRLLLLEQLYRGYSILRDVPYHRE